MRYLGLALYAEGPTDYRFLPSILLRLTNDLCLRGASEVVEVSDVQALDTPEEHREADRATRILEAARSVRGAFSILFVHADGGGDPEAAFQERVEPAARRIHENTKGGDERVVAVVPVRETEAWALTDGDALRGAFGSTLADSTFALPQHAHEVERVADPKQLLEYAFVQAIGKKRKRKAVHHLEAISQRVRLERLREVPAFLRFEAALSAALTDLGFLSGEME